MMVELGMYRDQLANYAEHFSRDQMRVFLFEALANSTEHVVRQLFELISVDPTAEIDTTERHNESSRLTNARLYQALY
jgi:chaperonin GroEL (HSP60 family)